MVKFLDSLPRVHLRHITLAETYCSEFYCDGDRNHGRREKEVGERLFLSPGCGTELWRNFEVDLARFWHLPFLLLSPPAAGPWGVHKVTPCDVRNDVKRTLALEDGCTGQPRLRLGVRGQREGKGGLEIQSDVLFGASDGAILRCP